MNSVVRPTCDEQIIESKHPVREPAHNPTWTLVAMILGSSLSFIDGTVVNVALPSIQRELGASAANVQWVVESYSLFLSALILVGGSLGDRYGRKRIYTIGIIVFTVASIACGVAPTSTVLIVARAAQGIGGALLVPGSLSILSATFDERRRGAAIGAWSSFTTITTAIGPVLGGWLVQTLSWRWVFFINVPLAAITLALVFWRVAESRDDEISGPLDWQGAALVTLGLGALVFGLIQASSIGLGAPMVVGLLALGFVSLAGFVFVEMRSPAPMMPLRLFSSRTFTGANLLTLLLYGALSGALYFLPFNLQQVQGYSPAEAGAALLPFTIVVFLFSRWSGGLVQRIGAKTPLVVGATLVAVSFAMFSLPGIGGSYWLTFFPAVLVLSFGMSLVIAPLTTSVMNAAPVAQSGAASGINNAVSRSSGLIAIAVMNLIIVAFFNPAFDSNLAALHLGPALQHAMDAQRERLAGALPPPGTAPALSAAITHAVALAYVAGFRAVMVVCAVLSLASGGIAALLVSGKPPQGQAAAAPDLSQTGEKTCTHLDHIHAVTPSTEGCEECMKAGDTWISLRMCLECGHVGCCDSSRNHHATAHYHATQHPIIEEYPHAAWRWCYEDEMLV